MSKKTYRMILIDPKTRTVTEHQVNTAYKVMAEMIGSPPAIDTFRIADFPDTWDYGYVDDSGLQRGEPIHAFQFIGRPDPVAGACLLYGCEKGTGETCDAKFDLHTLEQLIQWLGVITPQVTWEKDGNVDRAKVTWDHRGE